MLIGIISDVHSNRYALDAVLEDMPDVDRLVSLGDTIGYGPHPVECYERVREQADVVLRGNHEDNVEYPLNYVANPMAHKGLKHSNEELSEEALEWLVNRNTTETVFDGLLQISHGHPNETRPFQYVRERNVPEMVSYVNDSPADFLAVGHSHVQQKHDLTQYPDGNGWFFNPGSVGQPRDEDPRAAYATVETDTDTTDPITLHRVEYDIEATINDMEANGLHKKAAMRLREGK